MIYSLLRRLLFFFPPEEVHYFSMNVLSKGCDVRLIKTFLQKGFQFKSDALQKSVFGLTFKNPVGLGAGFDKNALYLNELETLGFGFAEVGTVTPLPQPGNDKPRLFRLPADKALINRMGFNNNGVKAVAAKLRLRRLAISNDAAMIIGGNIGKNKATPNEDAWKDYELCFKELFDCVDYFVVNVSSPNTPGLRELQEKDSLRKILAHLQTINQGSVNPKPLLLKIAPDLTVKQLDNIIDLAFEVKLSGFVATNTTISRNELSEQSKHKSQQFGAGGLSGKPLQNASTKIVKYLTHQTENKIAVIASGGIFNGADAKQKLDAGASLVQVWTGFIYEGPGIVKNICNSLIKPGKLPSL